MIYSLTIDKIRHLVSTVRERQCGSLRDIVEFTAQTEAGVSAAALVSSKSLQQSQAEDINRVQTKTDLNSLLNLKS